MLGISELKQTRVYQEAHQEGEQRGEQRGEQKLVLILLTQKFGELAPSLQEQIRQLSTPLPPVANHKALTLVLTLVD
jgi:predicted transposase YdaD